jgi:DivIVA domain-containing protein
MALTPEDVVNKRFQSTKFREGYDQDEVDDFLDEIVVELRRLGQENDEVKQRLIAADARIAELQRGGAASAPQEVMAPAVVAAPPVAPPMATPVSAEPLASPAPTTDSSDETNNLLQLARRLHEEHVREGVAKKEQLISEGEVEASRLVTEATTARQGQLYALDQERAALQQSVDELRAFERDYRQQLRSYIQSQLSELEGTAQPHTVAAASPVSSAGSVTSSAAPGSAPTLSSGQGFPGSAPSYSPPVQSAPGYSSPQTPPPGQFPGYGS